MSKKSGFRTKGLTIGRADRPTLPVSIGKLKEGIWDGNLKIEPNHLLIGTPVRGSGGFEA